VDGGDSLKDCFGPTYHRVTLVPMDQERFLGAVGGHFDNNLSFFDYGILKPDLINDNVIYRYSLGRSGWQFLDEHNRWNQFE
jgi:hypothetical protein